MKSAFESIVRHPTLGVFGLLLALGLGLLAIDRTQVQLMPTYKVDFATIHAEWTNASVEGMDEQVARHLDRIANSVAGVSQVFTTSTDGFVRLYVELDPKADTDAVIDRLEQALLDTPDLPAAIDPPVLRRYDASERIGHLVLYGPVEEESLVALKTHVLSRLQENGVSRVAFTGADPRPLLIEVDPTKAHDIGITLDKIATLLQANLSGSNTFTMVNRENAALTVRGVPQRHATLGAIPLGPKWNGLQLSDIATIGPAPAGSASRIVFPKGNGFFAEFRRGPNDDIIDLTRNIENTIDQLRSELPKTLTLQLYGMESHQIRDRIALLAKNGLLGVLLVFLVLYLFVGLETAFWVGIGIPTAFALSFVLMNLTHQTFNMVSVFTMVMIVGILVDDGIVVAEEISRRKSALMGVARTWVPVTISTVTTMVSFLPILLLTDEIGTYVSAIPWFVCVALLASLAECFVLLPNHMHHGRLIRSLPDLPGRAAARRAYDWFLTQPLRRFFARIARWPSLILATSLVLLVLPLVLVVTGELKFMFWLNPHSNFVFAHVTVPAGTDGDVMDQVFADIWAAADAASLTLSDSDASVLRTTFATTGRHFNRPETLGDPDKGSVLIELKDQDGQRIAPLQFLKTWQSHLPPQPEGISVEMTERLQGLRGPPISIEVSGQHVQDVRRAAQSVARQLESLPSLRDIRASANADRLEFVFAANDTPNILGIAQTDVVSDVTLALNGLHSRGVWDGRDPVEWQLRFAQDGPIHSTLDQIVFDPSRALRLSDVVEGDFQRAFSRLQRRNGKITLNVTAYHDPDILSLEAVRTRFQEDIAPAITADFPVELNQTGHIRARDTSLSQVATAFVVGLSLIYAVLALTMKSFLSPLLVMALLPFGTAGALLGHYLMGYTATLLSLVALVGLYGVLVNDTILLFQEVQHQRRKSLDWFDAVHRGFSVRLRAILLTSATTILGLSPLMLEQSYQAQFLIPIAITIAFGLGTSTLILFVLVPAFAAIFDTSNRS